MGKKCVPGTIFCVGNMTLFLCMFLLLIVGYLWVRVSNLGKADKVSNVSVIHSTPNVRQLNNELVPIQDIRGDVGRCGSNGMTIGDPLSNPYVPPIRCDAGSMTTPTLMVRSPGAISIPINMPTQSYNTQYSQIGILTRQVNTGSQDIIPLMGRRSPNSRSNWQYYTLSGGGPGGNMQTKLPVKVKGKSCSSEYGCDEIYNNDSVFVEGYQDEFKATVYDSGLFSYIPF